MYDPLEKPSAVANKARRGTEKQQEARSRNWKIYQLRSLQNQCFFRLSGDRTQRVIEIIDEELAVLGARSFKEQRKFQ